MSELRQRRPRVRDEGYLAFLRTRPCCVCGAVGRSQAAHIRMGCQSIDKPSTGMQQKPDDRWAVPLCGPRFDGEPSKGCHALQHSGSEADFWSWFERNPFTIAMRLFSQYEAERPEKAAQTPSRKRAQKTTRSPKRSWRKPEGRGWPQRKLQGRGFPKTKRRFR